MRSQAVQAIDREISKTVKEVQELQGKLNAATRRVKTSQEVFKTVYAVPIKSCTVSDSGLPSVLGFPVTPNQFSILSEEEVAKIRAMSRAESGKPKIDESSEATSFIEY